MILKLRPQLSALHEPWNPSSIICDIYMEGKAEVPWRVEGYISLRKDTLWVSVLALSFYICRVLHQFLNLSDLPFP